MSLVTSQAQNIVTIQGNGLAVYLDNQGVIQFKDIRGKTATLSSFLSSVFEAGSGSASIKPVSGANFASGAYATITGGTLNCGTASETFIGNGCSNEASTSFGSVVNGLRNCITGNQHAIIGAGIDNYISGSSAYSHSTILNGCQNSILNGGYGWNMILNGNANKVFGDYATHSTIVNGANNIVCGDCQFIGNGSANHIGSAGSNAFIGSGTNNFINNSDAFIGTGITNHVTSGSSAIITGNANCVSSSFGSVVNGLRNCITGNQHAIIGAGIDNYISGSSAYSHSTILNGCQNSILNGGYGWNMILNGNANKVFGDYATHSTIVNGANNIVCGDCQFIGSGSANHIGSGGSNAFIGSGTNNFAYNSDTFIGTGVTNHAIGTSSAILTGNTNCVTGHNATILNGCQNIITGNKSIVLTGDTNVIRNCMSVVSGLNTISCGNFGWAHGSGAVANANYAGAFGNGVINSTANSWMACQLKGDNLTGGSVNICVDANGIIVRDASDARLKTNIKPVSNGLALAVNLNPVRFSWNEIGSERFGQQREIGFIAQEVNKVIPEAVSVSKQGEYAMSKDKLVAVSISAIQELNQHICGICEFINSSSQMPKK